MTTGHNIQDWSCIGPTSPSLGHSHLKSTNLFEGVPGENIYHVAQVMEEERQHHWPGPPGPQQGISHGAFEKYAPAGCIHSAVSSKKDILLAVSVDEILNESDKTVSATKKGIYFHPLQIGRQAASHRHLVEMAQVMPESPGAMDHLFGVRQNGVSGKGACMIDQNQLPVRIDQYIALISVNVVDEIVKYIHVPHLSVPG